MAWLLTARDFARFEGPLGTEFIAAISDRYPDLAEASLARIADQMAAYDPDQLAGVISLIKGKLFERLVALHENADGDGWQAVLHEDESFPGSDIDLVNEATGEVQAKGHFLRDGMRPVKPWPRPKWAFCETNPFFWSRQNGHFAKRTHFFGAANMSILRNEPIFLEPPK